MSDEDSDSEYAGDFEAVDYGKTPADLTTTRVSGEFPRSWSQPAGAAHHPTKGLDQSHLWTGLTVVLLALTFWALVSNHPHPTAIAGMSIATATLTLTRGR